MTYRSHTCFVCSQTDDIPFSCILCVLLNSWQIFLIHSVGAVKKWIEAFIHSVCGIKQMTYRSNIFCVSSNAAPRRSFGLSTFSMVFCHCATSPLRQLPPYNLVHCSRSVWKIAVLQFRTFAPYSLVYCSRKLWYYFLRRHPSATGNWPNSTRWLVLWSVRREWGTLVCMMQIT